MRNGPEEHVVPNWQVPGNVSPIDEALPAEWFPRDLDKGWDANNNWLDHW
jgi:hypothetical protein